MIISHLCDFGTLFEVILAPGDTFRAAGFEQLQKWSERSGAKIGSFEEGRRPSTVLYQTLETGKTHFEHYLYFERDLYL